MNGDRLNEPKGGINLLVVGFEYAGHHHFYTFLPDGAAAVIQAAARHATAGRFPPVMVHSIGRLVQEALDSLAK